MSNRSIATTLSHAFAIDSGPLSILAHRTGIALAMACLVFAMSPGASAADYYLDPVTGSLSNPGTRSAPWPSLQDVTSSGKSFAAGDRLLLLQGFHGSPVLKTVNSSEIIVRPDTGARATLKALTIQSGQRWRVQGLEISPSLAPPYERIGIVTISGGSDNIVEDCLIYSIADSSRWTATDWNTLACNGLSVTGTRNQVLDNHLLNVNFGIVAGSAGSNNLIRGNTVENFSGDGMRGIGNYCVFEYNTVKNCYKVNSNHDDGFQSWSLGSGGAGTGVIKGVVLRGNVFINNEDPAQPMRGALQGIGCFDGFYEDWVVENNVVFSNHYNGITFLGARNCRIVNNTVIDVVSDSPGPPWIKIAAHKDGTPSTGNLVRNNLATDISVDSGAATVDHNREISTSSYATYFVDVNGFNVRLVAGCPAIDAGVADRAPDLDADGLGRIADGNGDGTSLPDQGAYERGGRPPTPTAPTDLKVTP